jgi:hypothetical protein
MGFADLSIAAIATEYDLAPEKVLGLCDRLKITYKDGQTNLALEDAKAVIQVILQERESSRSVG